MLTALNGAVAVTPQAVLAPGDEELALPALVVAIGTVYRRNRTSASGVVPEILHVLAVAVGYYVGSKHAGRLKQIEAEVDTDGHAAAISSTGPKQSHPEHIGQMDGDDWDTWDEKYSHGPDQPAESDE